MTPIAIFIYAIFAALMIKLGLWMDQRAERAKIRKEITTMLKAKDLKFHSAENRENMPAAITCSYCGHPAKLKQPLAAEVSIGDTDQKLVVVVCDDICRELFQEHPMSDNHITNTIDQIQAIRQQYGDRNGLYEID